MTTQSTKPQFPLSPLALECRRLIQEAEKVVPRDHKGEAGRMVRASEIYDKYRRPA